MKKKHAHVRIIDPEALDCFTVMAHRAASSKKIKKALMAEEFQDQLTLSELSYIRKIARAYKGATTLFTRQCHPEMATLENNLFLFSDKLASAAQALSQAAGQPRQRASTPADEHPCFSPFHAQPRPCLHDGALEEWITEPGMLTLVFSGDFANEPLDENRHMEVRFLNPQVKTLLRGIPSRLSSRAETGSFLRSEAREKQRTSQAPRSELSFASYRRRGESCSLGFDQLRWIGDEERSLRGEPLSWKIMFVAGSRPFELAIGFESIEFTFGMAAIQARREAAALAKFLQDPSLPEPARGTRPRI